MADDPKKSCDRGEEVTLGPAVGPNARLCIRHTADHERVPGVAMRIPEGTSMTGMSEVFTLKPKDPENGVFHVESVKIPAPPGATRGKPAKVSNDQFRSGWETTFGKNVVVGQA